MRSNGCIPLNLRTFRFQDAFPGHSLIPIEPIKTTTNHILWLLPVTRIQHPAHQAHSKNPPKVHENSHRRPTGVCWHRPCNYCLHCFKGIYKRRMLLYYVNAYRSWILGWSHQFRILFLTLYLSQAFHWNCTISASVKFLFHFIYFHLVLFQSTPHIGEKAGYTGICILLIRSGGIRHLFSYYKCF